jgi:hypothetical protein
LQEFEDDAGRVAFEILDSTSDPRYPGSILRAALYVAAYERSGFPLARLEAIASGRYPVRSTPEQSADFRHTALGALASRPRAELAAFWRGLLRDPHWAVRQHAVAGLACAEGFTAVETLRELVPIETDRIVQRVLSLTMKELTERDDSARVCMFGNWTRSRAASGVITPDPSLAARAARLFGFRR